MTDAGRLAGLPLTLALSPGGRGKRGQHRHAIATKVVRVERSSRCHPLPLRERAGVRGNRPC